MAIVQEELQRPSVLETQLSESEMLPEENDSEYLSSDESMYAEDEEITAEDLDFANPADYTKAYNRQRKLKDPNISEGEKPKTNPQHLVPEPEHNVETIQTKSNRRLRVDDQLSSLSHLAGRLRLDDLPGTRSDGRRDRAERATTENVLDPRTRLILLQMQNRNVFENINGCVSTGKEANVYHAIRSDSTTSGGVHIPPEIRHLAIKVFKTAILTFKDRERYIQGEHRFRRIKNAGSTSKGSRQMVKLWAEKEFRNLKRLHAAGLPVPQPLYLKQNVLAMKFLGNSKGYAYPRLKDVEFEDDSIADGWQGVYQLVLTHMRTMYQSCQLVHGDLSEFNMLFDPQKRQLYIIDVSQSVERSHPRSLEFLRMDIKNVRDFFSRKGVFVLSERETYDFVTDQKRGALDTQQGMIVELKQYEKRRAECTPEEREKLERDDEVFRQQYIPRTLEDVPDVDGDVAQVERGDGRSLVYRELLATDAQDNDVSISESELESEDGSEEYDNSQKDDKKPRGHRFEDKEEKKLRKQQVKAENRDKRTKKMKKHVKKQLVAASARPKRH